MPCSFTKAQAQNTISQTRHRQAVFLSRLSKKVLSHTDEQSGMNGLPIACIPLLSEHHLH